MSVKKMSLQNGKSTCIHQYLFGLITVVTVWAFYHAAARSKLVLIVVVLWMGIQGWLGLTGFYTDTSSSPPRVPLLMLPPLLLIMILLITKKGGVFMDQLNMRVLTAIHTVRTPVEVVMFLLCTHQMIPALMTFEGRNFDIFAGLTAPVVYYFRFIKNRMSQLALLIWNFLCLGLLVNIVLIAVLSAPLPFQKFAFQQPNIAILYFPFVWLPYCMVPCVLLSHLAAIRQLLKNKVGS